MKKILSAIGRFFAPPPDSSALKKATPYIVVAFLMIVLFALSITGWEASNSVKFCGLTCHTMPPEYVTHQRSAHANVTCEDCHMGRDTMNVMIPRKIAYSWQTGTAMLTNSYHYPIIAKNMRPARDACENCHNPAKFSSDKLFELKRFAEDKSNTLTTIYMMLKTGGGSSRQGLGFGIHWHVENPVYFYATDAERQDIPYVVVTHADGSATEYIDTEANFDPKSITKDKLQLMDCITCHNRTAHSVSSPQGTMDLLIGRGVVPADIPEIKKKGVEVLSAKYETQQKALDAISSLEQYYQQNHAEFYRLNSTLLKDAIDYIKDAYQASFFPEQKVEWTTHPNNMEHKDSPGCFRCHDGKHITSDSKDTVRLECNLCHSVPTVSTPFQLVSNVPVSKGIEPENHKNPNWINIHRTVFDKTCQACHTVDDPGGTSNKSFCSNSVCHGFNWKFAGFDAPKLREAIKSQLPTPTPPPPVQPTSAVEPTAAPTQPAVLPTIQPTASPSASSVTVTYAQVAPIFQQKCVACHGESGLKGVSLTSYARTMASIPGKPIVKAGKPDDSELIKVQLAGNHPGQMTPEEIELVKKWIAAGALEK